MAESSVACQRIVEVITDYLEGSSSGDERAQVEAHLERCPHCRRYLDQMRDVIRALGRLPKDAIAPECREELRRVFRTRTGQ